MPAAIALAVPDTVSLPTMTRRFDIPDLDRHKMWLLPRLYKAYPHLNERSLIGWLRSVIYSNEYLFLFQDDAVALAQCMSAHTMQPKPVVEERFVFVRDIESKEQAEAASEFYTQFAVWAKHHGAEVVIVEEMSDVPHEQIGKKLGRIFTRQQLFGRV